MSDHQQTDPNAVLAKYQQYIADWGRYVVPLDADRARSIDTAKEYALLALRTSFILNGGAIVALAPILQRVNVHWALPVIVDQSLWFVAGLILAATACAAAYINFEAHAQNFSALGVINDVHLKVNYGYLTGPADQVPDFMNVTKLQKRAERVVYITVWLGVLAGVCSFITLGIGAYNLSVIVQAALR